MSFALVNHATAVGASTATTPGVDTTGANLLVLVVASFTTNPVPAISDSKSNTWIPRTSYVGGASNNRVTIFYAVNPTVGAAHTVMAAQANEFATIDFAAFSGADTVSPYESENGAGSTSAATLQPGTVTPNEANALIISGASGALSATFSINLGFTITDQNTGSPSSFASAMAYLIQTNAVAVNPTWTESPSGKLAVNIAVFKAAASSTGLLLERRRKALLAL